MSQENDKAGEANELALVRKVLDAVEGESFTCPFCGGDNITWWDPEILGGRMYQENACDDCHKAWTLGYTADSVSLGDDFVYPGKGRRAEPST